MGARTALPAHPELTMQVDYEVIYSNRKTLGLTVERDGSVVVRAPHGTPAATIQEAIDQKKLWLYEKIGDERKYPLRPLQKEFVSGEAIPYLGRHYRLDIVKDDLPGLVFQSRFMLSRGQQPQAAALFREWYIARANQHLPDRSRHFASALGVNFNRVLVSDLRVRWGSCTPKNNLNFNWRIMKAPPFVVDYVVIHELAHLLEPNHTPRFWNIVAVQTPRCELAKKWLRDNGNLLEIEF